MARPEGLEPPAHCLEGSCSIHLSYGRIPVTSKNYTTMPRKNQVIRPNHLKSVRLVPIKRLKLIFKEKME